MENEGVGNKNKMYICEMNKLLICLGSNENSESNLSLCRKLLSQMFDPISFSSTSATVPYGDNYENYFLNQLAFACTNQEKEDIEFSLKLIEKQVGRQPNDKLNGVVKIDIDLIKWNDDILKAEDWERAYVVELLPSLQSIIDSSES